MNQKQTISSHLFRAILNTLKSYDININKFLENSKISKDLFINPDYRIDAEQIGLFWEQFNTQIKDEFLGLYLGSKINVSELGISGMFFTYSPTVREAFEKQIQFSKLFSDFLNINIYPISNTNEECIELIIDKHHPKPNYVSQCQSVMITKTIMEVAGNKHQPTKIWFDFPVSKNNLEKFSNYFQCPIVFDEGINAIAYKKETLDATLIHKDASILEHLEVLGKKKIQNRLQENYLIQEIFSLIKSSFYASNKAISLSEIAKQMNISGRTLQRKLKQESSSYSDILEKVRKEEALALLKQQKFNINEIAWFLGYSEASTFIHQFKNWTGASPNSFRKGTFN